MIKTIDPSGKITLKESLVERNKGKKKRPKTIIIIIIILISQQKLNDYKCCFVCCWLFDSPSKAKERNDLGTVRNLEVKH